MIPFFGQGDFQTSANMTPQQIERKRALMAVLQPRFGQARYVGEGIGQLATGIAMGAQDRKMDRAEGVNEQGRQSIMDRIFGGVSSQPDMGGTGFSVLGQAPVAERPMVQDDASRIGGGGDMSKYREAIASIESKGSGDYAAIGPTHQKLGRALGRYQVMEANIGPWSRAALGREVTPEEFLANPQIQDAVFDHRFGQYVQRHGPEAAAQAWFAGEGGIGQLGRKDSLGTTVGAYTDKFSRAIGGAGGGQAPTPAQSGPDMSALYQALSSPLLRQEDRALIMSEIQRREQAADPMRAMQMQGAQLGLEKTRLELEQMRNPQADPLKAVQLETAQLNLERLRAGAGNDPNVQSSATLPDMSGVVLTMRDGSVEVRSVTGETITGQEAIDYVRQSQERNAVYQRSITGARREGTLSAEVDMAGAAEGAKKAGALTMERAFEAFDQASAANSSISTINEAIAAIDRGANAGIVYNMLPAVGEASASLRNAMNRMGLDVISSVTFGALSEAEMNLAMETAAPRNLGPEELRVWLERKADAQAKTRDALLAAARYLSQPGNTINGWMDQQQSQSNQTPGANNAPAPAPVAAQQPAPRAGSGPRADGQPAPASGINFSAMSLQDLLNIDVNSLSPEEMLAMQRRFDEVSR